MIATSDGRGDRPRPSAEWKQIRAHHGESAGLLEGASVRWCGTDDRPEIWSGQAASRDARSPGLGESSHSLANCSSANCLVANPWGIKTILARAALAQTRTFQKERRKFSFVVLNVSKEPSGSSSSPGFLSEDWASINETRASSRLGLSPATTKLLTMTSIRIVLDFLTLFSGL